jgi:hypothetical protein
MGLKPSKPQSILSNIMKSLPTKPSIKAIKKPGSLSINQSFLSIENNNINLLNKSFTIEFWVKTMESNNGWIFNAGNVGIGFEGSRLKYLWNGQKFRLSPDSAPAIGSWVFVRMCFDNNNLTFFVNNVSTSVAIQQPLNTPPTANMIIGNDSDQPGFVGKIADFRISLENICASNNTIPTNKLTVSNTTALLIAPIDTNPFIDVANKNRITNMVVRYDSEYPLNIEGFANEESNNRKLIGYILLMIIISVVLWMSFKKNDISLSSTSSNVFQRPF